ncbi:hypothetical protein MRX96_044304 [Rhipicephalus microplus]
MHLLPTMRRRSAYSGELTVHPETYTTRLEEDDADRTQARLRDKNDRHSKCHERIRHYTTSIAASWGGCLQGTRARCTRRAENTPGYLHVMRSNYTELHSIAEWHCVGAAGYVHRARLMKTAHS